MSEYENNMIGATRLINNHNMRVGGQTTAAPRERPGVRVGNALKRIIGSTKTRAVEEDRYVGNANRDQRDMGREGGRLGTSKIAVLVAYCDGKRGVACMGVRTSWRTFAIGPAQYIQVFASTRLEDRSSSMRDVGEIRDIGDSVAL